MITSRRREMEGTRWRGDGQRGPSRRTAPVATDPRSTVRPRRVLVAAALAVASLASASCSAALRRPTPPSAADSAQTIAHLNAILLAHWEFVSNEWPGITLRTGVTPWTLPDISYATAKTESQFGRAAIRELDQLQVNALSEPSYITWLTLRSDMGVLSRRSAYYWTDLSFATPSNSPLMVALDVLQRQPFADSDDVDGYARLLGGMAALADSVRSGLTERAGRNVVLPRREITRAAALVRRLIADGSAAPYMPADARLDELADVERRRLGERVHEIVEGRLNPALERLATYLEGEYAARAPEAIGLGQYTGGLEFYRFLLQDQTTLDVSPEQAHSIGLSEVVRLDTLLLAAARASGLPENMAALRAQVLSDAGHVDGSPKAISERLASVTLRVDSLVRDSMNVGALMPVRYRALSGNAGAAPWPARLEIATMADSAATLWFDSGSVQLRVDWLLPAVAYEALVPGRLLQLGRERADSALPVYRRVTDRAGLADGWAAYAIEVALDLGLPRNTRERFGALLREMTIACGLVIDTGVNYFGWTPEQALAFLRHQLPYDDAELEQQFIVPTMESPGRLSAGALGARELKGMRDWIGTERGEGFDRSRFVDALLSQGAVPLPVLGSHLEWWLWESTRPAPTDTGGRQAATRQRR